MRLRIITFLILALLLSGCARKEGPQIEDTDHYAFIRPVNIYDTALINQQGMTSDGEWLYVTHREIDADRTPTELAKIDLSTMKVSENAVLGEGHFNSLSYYDGKIYATAGDVKSKEEPGKKHLPSWEQIGVSEIKAFVLSVANITKNQADYHAIAMINPGSLAIEQTKRVDESAWGLDIYQFSETTAPIIGVYVGSSRNLSFYAGYHDADDPEWISPLVSIQLDYTGSETVQGSFAMSQNYIWVVRTVWNEEGKGSGHNVISCHSYSGMTVKEFYLEGIEEELQDIYVTEDEQSFFVNTREGKIYEFQILPLYHTIASSASQSNVFPPGTIKHVYSYPSPLDEVYVFDGKTISKTIFMSDFMYTSEIACIMPVSVNLNGCKWQGSSDSSQRTLSFNGIDAFENGNQLWFNIIYKRGLSESGHNYIYTLSEVRFQTWEYGNEVETHSYRADQEEDIRTVLDELCETGWITDDLYISEISYTLG